MRRSSSNFSFSSFKDIENLCAADDSDSKPYQPQPQPQHQPQPQTPQQVPLSPFKKASIFHRVRRANSFARAFVNRPKILLPDSVPESPSSNAAVEKYEPSISIPGAEKRIVVYYTSLRVIRSTFEDCRTVQSILRGFRVSIDERDLSMDSRFLDELQRIMGQIEKTKLTLPRVFIGGRYIGGAEEIRQLHETGELKKFVEGLPAAEPGVCEMCGAFRFILCDECNGSHKCYTEKNGFRSCTSCNENGLIRCPSCLSR